MNLPDKIDMTYGTLVDFKAIGCAINQIIDYLKELEQLSNKPTKGGEVK